MKDNRATLFGNSTAVADWRMECLGRYMNNRYSRSGNRQTWEYINSTHVAPSLQRCDSEVYNLRLVYHAFILTLSFYSLSLRWKFSSESVLAEYATRWWHCASMLSTSVTTVDDSLLGASFVRYWDLLQPIPRHHGSPSKRQQLRMAVPNVRQGKRPSRSTKKASSRRWDCWR